MAALANYLRWFFTDGKGRVVIWQRPNLPLALGLAGWLLAAVLPYGQLNFLAALLRFGFLFTWAWLELAGGESPFRRCLGGIGMVWLLSANL